MRLTIVAGEAMKTVMNEHGVDIGRINYQDNGNWRVFHPEGPYLHIHLYGRAKSSKKQKYGEACFFPSRKDDPEFYQNNTPLNQKDVEGIRKEIKRLLTLEKYSDSIWKLTKT